MQLCRFCGFYNKDDAVYCSSCDSPLSPHTNPRIPKELAEAIARSEGERASQLSSSPPQSVKIRFESQELAPPPLSGGDSGPSGWGGSGSEASVGGERGGSRGNSGQSPPHRGGMNPPYSGTPSGWGGASSGERVQVERGDPSSFVDAATPTKALLSSRPGESPKSPASTGGVDSALSSNTPTELVSPRSSSSDYVIHQISIEDMEKSSEFSKRSIRQTLYYDESTEEEERIEINPSSNHSVLEPPDEGNLNSKGIEYSGDLEGGVRAGVPLYGGWKVLSTGLLVILILLSVGFFSVVVYMFFFNADEEEGDISKEIAKIASRESGTDESSKKKGAGNLPVGLDLSEGGDLEEQLKKAQGLLLAYNLKGASEVLKELREKAEDEKLRKKVEELSQKIATEKKFLRRYLEAKESAAKGDWKSALKVINSIPRDSIFRSKALGLEKELKNKYIYPQLRRVERLFRRRKLSSLMKLEELRLLLPGDPRIKKLGQNLYTKTQYLFSRCEMRCKRRYRRRSRYIRRRRERCIKRCNYRYPTEKFVQSLVNRKLCLDKCWEERAEKYQKVCRRYYPRRARKRRRCLALWKKKTLRRVCSKRCRNL